MLARNQQHMNGRLGIGIFDSDDLLILVNKFGRNVLGYDATKDAALFDVFHSFYLKAIINQGSQLSQTLN